MSDYKKPIDLDIDQLIRENAQAVADYENSENVENQQQDLQDRQALRRVAGLSTAHFVNRKINAETAHFVSLSFRLV